MTEAQTKILNQWYGILDQDYGEHGDPDDSCKICWEALQLGIIEEKDTQLMEEDK